MKTSEETANVEKKCREMSHVLLLRDSNLAHRHIGRLDCVQCAVFPENFKLFNQDSKTKNLLMQYSYFSTENKYCEFIVFNFSFSVRRAVVANAMTVS